LRQPWILEPTQTTRSVLRGLVVLRWGTWAWATLATTLADERLARPWLAVALLGGALVVNVAATLERRLPAAAELAVGFALLAGEGWVFEPGHAFGGYQGLAGGWPIVGIIVAGITLGPWPAAIGGALVGTARIVGVEANGVDSFDATRVASLAATVAFYALYGAAAGWVGRFLRTAEREVGAARAREEVARTLHDGVLQTLAVIQRRSGDDELVRLARSQEAALRRYLADPLDHDAGARPAEGVLRAAAADAIARFGLRVEVAAVPPLPVLDAQVAAAVQGAVGEGLANVAKHAGTDRAVVFAEAEADRLVVSVQDDGAGFDPAGATERGLDASIRRRLASVGGAADVRSRPGGGTTVTLEIPLERR